ncbi:hypothetical protein KBD59_02675 [Candidatus Gracilibacteria bacterium]|nr:hypothetical protein [Candidatus Gracilibacteria bacterium]
MPQKIADRLAAELHEHDAGSLSDVYHTVKLSCRASDARDVLAPLIDEVLDTVMCNVNIVIPEVEEEGAVLPPHTLSLRDFDGIDERLTRIIQDPTTQLSLRRGDLVKYVPHDRAHDEGEILHEYLLKELRNLGEGKLLRCIDGELGGDVSLDDESALPKHIRRMQKILSGCTILSPEIIRALFVASERHHYLAPLFNETKGLHGSRTDEAVRAGLESLQVDDTVLVLSKSVARGKRGKRGKTEHHCYPGKVVYSGEHPDDRTLYQVILTPDVLPEARSLVDGHALHLYKAPHRALSVSDHEGLWPPHDELSDSRYSAFKLVTSH